MRVALVIPGEREEGAANAGSVKALGLGFLRRWLMKRMGVREIKMHWSSVLDDVSRHGEVVEVTRHGRVIARVVPVRAPDEGKHNASAQATLTDLESLRAEISKAWPEGVSVQEVIDDLRS
jgi:prevent-host-death family protein